LPMLVPDLFAVSWSHYGVRLGPKKWDSALVRGTQLATSMPEVERHYCAIMASHVAVHAAMTGWTSVCVKKDGSLTAVSDVVVVGHQVCPHIQRSSPFQSICSRVRGL